MSTDEAVTLFAPAPFRWWIAGGHALDAHLHRAWRAHGDLDIGICRHDAPALAEILAGWDIHRAAAGRLSPWDGGPLSADRAPNNLWCRRSPDGPWCLDVTLGAGDDRSWIYRRDPTIQRPWDEAVLTGHDGVPYLAPELQLLFKSTGGRPKDDLDAAEVLPALDPTRRTWVADHLPADHRWQLLIGRVRALHAATADTDTDAEAGAQNPAGDTGGGHHGGQEGTDQPQVELLALGRTSQAWLVTDDGDPRVVRVPVPNSGRRSTYRAEARLGSLLTATGHPVVQWRTVGVDANVSCSVGPLLEGQPIAYDEPWPDPVVAGLATLLRDLHTLPVAGYGPLTDSDGRLRGDSASPLAGVLDRWIHAPIWPFDGTRLDAHPVAGAAPDLVAPLAAMEGTILAAASGPFGIVHSDLHQEHILVTRTPIAGTSPRLVGVLDFGAAFVGSTAWDVALLRWYYGQTTTERVVAAYRREASVDGDDLLARGHALAVAVGCYKLARNPTDPTVISRLRAALA